MPHVRKVQAVYFPPSISQVKKMLAKDLQLVSLWLEKSSPVGGNAVSGISGACKGSNPPVVREGMISCLYLRQTSTYKRTLFNRFGGLSGSHDILMNNLYLGRILRGRIGGLFR